MYDDEPTMMGQAIRPKALLVVRRGTQAGMSFPLISNQVTLGREEGSDVILQDPEASRRHSRLSFQGGQYIVEDLGSTNGTFLNETQLTAPQVLQPGDSIGIGQTALVFQLADAQPQAGMPIDPPQAGAVDYSAVPQEEPASDGGNSLLKYAMYGCGCLFLFMLCFLILVAVFVVTNQEFVNELLNQLGALPYNPTLELWI